MKISIDTKLYLFFLTLFLLIQLTFSLLTCSDTLIIPDPITLNPDKLFCAKDESKIVLNGPISARYNQYNNLVYVVDSKDHDIKVFDEDLNYITKFGRFGQGPGEFSHPFHITFDSSRKIYVADFSNARIQIFSKEYKFLSSLKHAYFHPGTENIEVDSRGNIYAINKNLEGKIFTVYNSKGETIDEFGEVTFSTNMSQKNKELNLIISRRVLFSVDSNDEVYCGYLHKPIIQKYDRFHKLVYQLDISYLDEAIKYEKVVSSKISKIQGVIINYIICLTIDDKYLYVRLNNPDEKHENFNQIYVIRKVDGQIINRIRLKLNAGQNFEIIYYYDPIHSDFIYCTEVISGCLVRVKKPYF